VERFDLGQGDLHRFTVEGHYRVDLGAFSLDLYFRPSAVRRCVIISPGFLSPTEFKYPYFQRVKWLAQFEAVGISLADPTLQLSDKIGIGWFIGTRASHYLEVVAGFLARLLAHLGVPASSTLFFGSSAGGFASLGFAALIPGAKAFAVNPQTDIKRFHHVGELGSTLRACLQSGDLEALTRAYDRRLSLLALLHHTRHVPEMVIWQNIHDKWHYSLHVLPFLEGLAAFPAVHDVKLIIAARPDLGHNPPALPELRAEFDMLLRGL